MKKIAIISLVLASVLSVGAITFTAISWGNTASALGDYKDQLEYVYQRNLFELIDNVSNVETDLSKLQVSSSVGVQQKYLSTIIANTNSAQNNLATLPIEHTAIDKTTTFINQLSGFCLIQSRKLSVGQSISLDDMDQVDKLHSASEDIKFELNKLSTLIMNGYRIVDNTKDPSEFTNDFSDQFSGIKNDVVEYPTLIYDGPFSDSVTNKTIKGLSKNEINAEEAKRVLSQAFGNYTINSESVSQGDFDTFNFDIQVDEANYYVQITKKGGFLLSVNSQADDSSQKNKTLDECSAIAENFATKLGLKEAKTAWSTINNGFAYINLTSWVDNVLIYPDMIKVKVDMSTGRIVAWEAREWAYNHVVRNNLSPSIDEIQARAQVPTELDIRRVRLAVIPNDYVGETLTWEFMCIFSGATYYVYIDANTGEEVNILRVIETDDGNLLM